MSVTLINQNYNHYDKCASPSDEPEASVSSGIAGNGSEHGGGPTASAAATPTSGARLGASVAGTHAASIPLLRGRNGSHDCGVSFLDIFFFELIQKVVLCFESGLKGVLK